MAKPKNPARPNSRHELGSKDPDNFFSARKFTGALAGYRESRIRIEMVKPKKKETAASKLPRQLQVPIPSKALNATSSLKIEFERRYKLLVSSLGFPVENPDWVERVDWPEAFKRLALLTVRGLSASKRGRLPVQDHAFLDRITLLKMARHAANKVLQREMTIPQIAKILAEKGNCAQLPESFRNRGYETIRKALYRAFDESVPSVKPDPNNWQFDWTNRPMSITSDGEGNIKYGPTLDPLPWRR